MARGRDSGPREPGFDAAFVSVEEDAALWLVGFADAQFGAQRQIILQREKSPSADDVALGLDGYRVEVDDDAGACYGGIESFELFRDHAVVEFEDGAIPLIDGSRTVIVRFALRERQLAQLRGCLARIFEGDDCFLDLTV